MKEATILRCLTCHALSFLSDAVDRTECCRAFVGLDSKISSKILTLYLSARYLLLQTGLKLLNVADDSPSLEPIASYGAPPAVMTVPKYLYLCT